MSEPRMPCAELDALAELLGSCRFDLSNEYAIQRGIEALFARELEPDAWRREVRLSARDRVDFLVGEIAVEVKHARQRHALILRQLERYAVHPTVAALILVTATAVGWSGDVGGKPLRVVSTGAAWL